MDIIKLYQDYNVEFVTEGHKHARPGWVNCECPYCSSPSTNPGYHLGWNMDEEYYFCWRCGWHPPVKTISLLLNVSISQAIELMNVYGINRTVTTIKKVDKKDFELPSNCGELSYMHRKYLISRGFNARKIERLWKIKATSHFSILDNINYKFRIIIPFFWNGQMVSFDSRDISNKQLSKYKACPKEREIIEHKHILYGNQEHWIDTGIGVEGPTDVWRLGPLSCATSGIEYTQAQVRIIAQTFKRFAVIFDDEPQAQRQAKKLVAELKFRGVDAWNIKIKGDPGSLKQSEADELIKSILK